MGLFRLRRTATGVKFDLVAKNGEVIATSEVYRTRAACEKGVASVRRCAAVAALEDQTQPAAPVCRHPKFELYQDRAGAYRFRLKARNGQVIAISEPYRTRAACEKGILSVRTNAPDAGVAGG